MAFAFIDKEIEATNDSIVNKSDTQKLSQIIRKAQLLLGNIGVKVDPNDIIFEIVNKEEIKHLCSDFENVVGFTCPISIEGKCHKIWLLEDRPYILLLSVVTHEIGHTWCRKQGIKFSKMEEEGFCELLGYHILSTQYSKQGNIWMERMIQNPDIIYGDGLRHMKKQLERCNNLWTKFLGFIKLCHR